MVVLRFEGVGWYFEEGASLKMVVSYSEEGGVYFEGCGLVIWRGRCGTLKIVMWYFEEGGTLKMGVSYSEEGGVVFWRRWFSNLKRIVWYFEENGVVLWRSRCSF